MSSTQWSLEDSPPSATLSEPRGYREHQRTAFLALTVIAHPHLERIGERALLDGLEREDGVVLSRRAPRFGTPRGTATRSLEDRFLSRQPIRLHRLDGGGLEIDVSAVRRSVYADGEQIGSRQVFEETRVRAGITLLLSRRVVLFLHPLPATAPRTEDHFGLVGESPAMIAVRNEIIAAATTSHPVLVRGATGTGKELVAQAVHRRSERLEALVAVNLAAVPSSVAAAELFGAVPGGFTGARRQRGKIRQAHHGTLFLDEIGDASMDIQTMLLRVLETGQVHPVGADRAEVIDFRLVAATDRDLDDAIEQGTFRQQLLFRLNSHIIRLPPLAARREDLGRLSVALLRRALAQDAGGPTLPGGEGGHRWLPAEMMDRFMRHPWPGNVRQLRGIAEQIVVDVRQSGGRPDPQSIMRRIDGYLGTSPTATPAPSSVPTGSFAARPVAQESTPTRRKQAAELTKEEILEAIGRTESMTAAARALGVSRAALYAQIKRLGLDTSDTVSAERLEGLHRDTGGDVARMAAILGISRQGLLKRLHTLGLR